MPLFFCRATENLTDEHVFPAFDVVTLPNCQSPSRYEVKGVKQ
jgi:hypothetical protein